MHVAGIHGENGASNRMDSMEGLHRFLRNHHFVDHQQPLNVVEKRRGDGAEPCEEWPFGSAAAPSERAEASIEVNALIFRRKSMPLMNH